ncbi:MAG: ComEC/Rec2 family competence protein [Candidatus Nomurabacteria bacterium]|nr:ComEC/Rec2 family competence protein [Candidatus Nomurabacteria bacterium]
MFRRRIHISWHIALLAAGFLLGVGLSLVPATAVFAQGWWLVLAVALAAMGLARRRVWTLSLLLLAGMLVGLWRGTIERVDLTGYQAFLGQNLTLTGKVFEDPSVEDNLVKLRLVEVEIDGVQLPGQVWASALGRISEVRRSDRVEISGKLKNGFGTFPATMSYARLLGVQPGQDDPARDLRDAFGEKLSNALGGAAQNLGMGILAGQKTALPPEVSEAFRIAGLTHIVVASGYNLTILIRFARRSFARISRLAALFGGGSLALGFACVTGFSPSMTRAALVAGLSLLAWYFGRKFHPIILLLVVAAATVVVNPMYVWGDAGWYMSFFAFAGVLIFAPLVQDYFWGGERAKPARKLSRLKQLGTDIRQIFIETTSAQLLTMPIIALMLGQFSPYGLLANLLVLPIVPITMLLTFVAGIVGWLVPVAAPIVGMPAQSLLDYIIWVSGAVAQLPGANHEVTFGLAPFAGVIALILTAIIYMRRRTRHQFRDNNVVA